eukprot:m.378629 g.378629  ORF g.378629 m.378629 type:complete len:1009 (-) comp28222_c0_seq4:2778-5804(-)
MWTVWVFRAVLVSSLISTVATLSRYQEFVLGKYLTCPDYAKLAPLKSTGSRGQSCCTEAQVRSFIFKPPLLSFQNNPDKIIALAAAEGVVFAMSDKGGVASGTPFAAITNCSNVTAYRHWVPPGDDPFAWCAEEKHNVTRSLAYNAALAASSGNRPDAELGAAFADQQYNNSHGLQSCAIPYLIPALAQGTGCAGGQFINHTSNETSPCLPGYFCPVTLPCLIRCTSGAYCNDTTQNAQGWREAACPVKKYCPKAVDIFNCPSGHFCEEAVAEPSKCNAFMVCPPGTGNPQINFTGLAVVGMMAVGMLLGLVIYQSRKRTARWWSRLWCYKVPKRRQRPTNVTDLVKLKLFRIRRGSAAQLDRHIESEYTDPVRRLSNMSDESDDALLGTGLAEPKQYALTIRYENLHLTVKTTGKTVLQNCTGTLKAGKVTAIMGPSGAGKSSFVGAITGSAATYGNITGDMYINGMKRTLSDFRDVCGFVPQDDTMHTDLKVREVLFYQAQLRLPESWSVAKKIEIVAYVIKLLGLEDVVESIIGNPEVRGISGGQRKRVNIGMELVADPTFLALDEPTSGLDSTSSLKVVGALKAVAIDQHLTVVAVIHQPRYEIFAQFDELLLLGKGGYTAYFGKTREAASYFEDLGFIRPDNMNPADFIMDALGGEIQHMEGKVIDFQSNWMTHCEMVLGQTGVDTAVTSGDSNKILNPSIQGTSNYDDDDDDLEELSRGVSRHYNDMAFAPRRLPSWKSQIWVFFKRRLVQFKRSSYTHTLDLLMVAFGGAVLGGTYLNASWHSYPQMATFSSLVIGMTSMIFSLRYFGMDTDVIRRETSTGIGIVPFFIAGNLVQLPLVFVLPMVYLAVVFPMLSPRSTLVLQYAIYVAVVWACTGLGIMISTLFHRSSAQVVAVVLSLTSAMFGGTSPTIPTMNQGGPGMFLVYDASYSRWFIEALTTAELTHVPVLYHLEVQGELSYLGYAGPSSDSGRIKFCCAMMFLMGLAARIVACLALWVTYVKS